MPAVLPDDATLALCYTLHFLGFLSIVGIRDPGGLLPCQPLWGGEGQLTFLPPNPSWPAALLCLRALSQLRRGPRLWASAWLLIQAPSVSAPKH